MRRLPHQGEAVQLQNPNEGVERHTGQATGKAADVSGLAGSAAWRVWRRFLARRGDIRADGFLQGAANFIERSALHGDVEIEAKAFPLADMAAGEAKEIAHSSLSAGRGLPRRDVAPPVLP